jgi:hypothetical protein
MICFLQKLENLTIFFILFFFFGCKPEKRWDCIKSTGKITSETRYPMPFKKIEVHDKIEVEIFLDSVYKVEIQAGKNLLPKIITDVQDSNLVIKNLNRCNFMRDTEKKIRVKIFMPFLLSIYQYGYGNIYLRDELFTDSIAVFNEGNGDIHLKTQTKILYAASYASGDMYFSGTATHLYYHFNGGNFLHAKDLWVKEYAYISHFSIGDAYVYCTGWLDGELRGTGNIYYKGNPEILNFKITKGGKLIAIP